MNVVAIERGKTQYDATLAIWGTLSNSSLVVLTIQEGRFGSWPADFEIPRGSFHMYALLWTASSRQKRPLLSLSIRAPAVMLFSVCGKTPCLFARLVRHQSATGVLAGSKEGACSRPPPKDVPAKTIGYHHNRTIVLPIKCPS